MEKEVPLAEPRANLRHPPIRMDHATIQPMLHTAYAMLGAQVPALGQTQLFQFKAKKGKSDLIF